MRDNIHGYYVKMLGLVASRSTCSRRQVGAIITDEKGHLLATGYNGPPSGEPHCTDLPCAGAHDPAGDSRRCLSVHGEINCLIQCGQLFRARRMYVTCTPCFACAKAIVNTPIEQVIITAAYADDEGGKLLRRLGRLFMFDYEAENIVKLVLMNP